MRGHGSSRGQRVLLAVLLSAAVTLVGLPAGQLSTPASANDELTDSLLEQALPADVTDAAVELVRLIYGPSQAVAEQAVAETLRRAGIPLVTTEGEPVALPDGPFILPDLPIYIEMVPDLTRAVRRGDYYEPAALAAWLDELGLGVELPADVLLGGLARWGKDPASPSVSRHAASAVRALAGIRREVLHGAAHPEDIHFDLLQTLLVVVHGISPARHRSDGGHLGRLALWGPAPVLASGECDRLHEALERRGWVEQRVTSEVSDKLKDAWKDLAGEPVKNAIGAAEKAWDKGAAGLSVLLLLMGTTLDLQAKNVSTGLPRTHTRGHAHADSGDMNVIAHAKFDSDLANKRIKCYALAGIDVPKSGNLSGFTIRWKLDQPQTARLGAVSGRGGTYLTTKSCCSSFLQSGSKTGGDGRSTLELVPARERQPEASEESKGQVIVYAWIDEQDLPFKLDEAIDIGKLVREAVKENKSAGGTSSIWALEKLYDLALSAMKKAGLPKKRVGVEVSYHGADIYQVKGGMRLFLGFLFMPMKVDLVSCAGLKGPWQGDFSLEIGDKTFLAEAQETVFGVEWPESGKLVNQVSAGTPNLKLGGSARLDMMARPLATGRLDVSSSRYDFDHIGSTVGHLEVLIEGQSTDSLSLFNGFGSRFPIVRLAQHASCPGGDNLEHDR